MNDSIKYRADIDGLRGIAVLLVLLFHAFPEWIRGGFVGVDVFFVISGYLITTILLKSHQHHSFSIREFYERRVRRIFPALLVVILSTLAAAWFLLLPPELAQVGKHAAAGLGFVANLVYWSESGYFDGDANQKPLLHLWSLGVEEQFYLVFPLLVYCCIKWRLKFMPVIIALGLLSFAVGVVMTWSHPSGAYYLPVARAWELLLGAGIAAAGLGLPGRQRLPRSAVAHNALGVVALLAVLASGFLISESSRFPGFWAALPVLGAGLMIWLGASREQFPGRILANRKLVFVGLISYPLYLWHWPLLTLARMLEGDEPSRRIRFVMLLLAVLLAWLTYRFIEKPIRSRQDHQGIIPGLLVLGVATAAAAFFIFTKAGFPERFPEAMPGLASYHYDPVSSYRRGKCFLDIDQGPESFASECFEAQGKAKKIVLWGDSHAAQLYPGLQSVYGDQAAIIQLTATRCPPIPSQDIHNRPLCRSINDAVSLKIAALKPDLVILAGAWHKYDWGKVTQTIASLRSADIENIVLVGPVPRWSEDLPRLLYRSMRRDPDNRIPSRTRHGLVSESEKLEAEMAPKISATGAIYISALAQLCNGEGCIVRTGNTVETITFWDTNHLTTEGSILLIARLAQDAKIPGDFQRSPSKLSSEAQQVLQRLQVQDKQDR